MGRNTEPIIGGVTVKLSRGMQSRGDGVPTKKDPLMCIPCRFLCDTPYYIP